MVTFKDSTKENLKHGSTDMKVIQPIPQRCTSNTCTMEDSPKHSVQTKINDMPSKIKISHTSAFKYPRSTSRSRDDKEKESMDSLSHQIEIDSKCMGSDSFPHLCKDENVKKPHQLQLLSKSKLSSHNLILDTVKRCAFRSIEINSIRSNGRSQQNSVPSSEFEGRTNVFTKEDNEFSDFFGNQQTHSIEPTHPHFTTSLTNDFDRESYLTPPNEEGSALSINSPPPPRERKNCDESERKNIRRETETILPESLSIPLIKDGLSSFPLSQENSSSRLLPKNPNKNL